MADDMHDVIVPNMKFSNCSGTAMFFGLLRNFAAFGMLLFGARSPVYAQSPVAKVVKFELADYGWQPLPKEQIGEWAGARSQLVSIDHQGRVLVGFATRENQSLASRENPGLSFHILRFTSEGKEDLSLVLPTNNLFTNGFYLGPSDQIFARANDTFQWMPEEDGSRKEGAAWQLLGPCPRNCRISQSSSRRTLTVSTNSKEMADRDYDRGIRTNTMLDASSSPPHVVQNCANSGTTITDKFSYQSSNNIRTDVRRWLLCDREHDTELPLDMRGGLVSALSDESLLLLGTAKDRRGIDLVRPNGQTRFHHEMPKHDVVRNEVRSDERGDRFAFTVQTWRGGVSALDIGGKVVAFRIVVYSEDGQELATVSLNPQLANISLNAYYYRRFDFSMSPDGHRLAILDEGVLTVHDVP
jgi:hypothetical protein